MPMYSNDGSRFISFVIKPLPHALRGLSGYAGATLIGDGRMVLILDVDGLRSSDH
uniref:chemotaxis protein CheW n=1 Tax=Xanthomonas sp. CPBF 426 TaxID=2750648 RepID=UPI00314029BA